MYVVHMKTKNVNWISLLVTDNSIIEQAKKAAAAFALNIFYYLLNDGINY